MKTIGIAIPCSNEEENVEELYGGIELCNRVRALVAGLGPLSPRATSVTSARLGMAFYQATGDAVIGLVADLRDPPEMIPDFIREWETG